MKIEVEVGGKKVIKNITNEVTAMIIKATLDAENKGIKTPAIMDMPGTEVEAYAAIYIHEIVEGAKNELGLEYAGFWSVKII